MVELLVRCAQHLVHKVAPPSGPDLECGISAVQLRVQVFGACESCRAFSAAPCMNARCRSLRMRWVQEVTLNIYHMLSRCVPML